MEIVNATDSSEEKSNSIQSFFDMEAKKYKKAQGTLVKQMSEKSVALSKLETQFYTNTLSVILEDLEDEKEIEKTLATYKKIFGGKDFIHYILYAAFRMSYLLIQNHALLTSLV